MTCVRRPQRLSFHLGIRFLVCTQYLLLYAFRLCLVCNCVHVSDFCCLIGMSVDFLSLYTRPLYASASMPSFLYACPLSTSASMPSLLRPQYALASQPPPLTSAACCCSAFISFFYDSDIYF
ncbi:uncharacterized protein EI90DRAFT_3092492 [Cantharellus anzutake]|uniref:uncharacterized protein n=1 Tax=Cantharellus anzutake TaxID=1750568 RepID=UPI001904C291|nr:uncharacterized protein EI90DRAFT_3092492 [Cantharellus anzutake]KAF8313033.1 hypothetical protein EI90DRAFT_3092492 [Cantharellus anzutake]